MVPPMWLIVLVVIAGSLIIFFLIGYGVSRMSQLRSEQQKLIITALGAVLLMAWFTVGIGLFPAGAGSPGCAWTLNILVAGLWALIVWFGHGRK